MPTTGTVVRFDRRRGYGFVQPDDGGEDVFVHQNNISMEGFRFLQVGEKVSYDLEVGEKGMKAVAVALVEPRQVRPGGDDGGFGGEERGFGGDDRGQQQQQDNRDNPAFQQAPRRRDAAPAPRAPRHSEGGADGGQLDKGQLEKLRRKQERLISLLVEKGMLAPGEIDALDGAKDAAGA